MVIGMMVDNFFRRRDEISIPKQRGDRLRISQTDGSPTNIEKQGDFYRIVLDAKERAEKFIKILSDLTSWEYDTNNWNWVDFNLHKFTKGDFTGAKISLNNKTFEEFISKKPLSWAMTSGQNIEYTLE